MKRSTRVTLLALGSVSCLVSAVGIFAPTTDTAETGLNAVETGALAFASDLQIADATEAGIIQCGSFNDGPAVSNLIAFGLAPGGATVHRYYCIKNVGSATVALSARVSDLVDLDVDCTGDEAAIDLTCGANGIGELSQNTSADINRIGCLGAGPPLQSAGGSLAGLNINFQAMGSLAPDEIGCFHTSVSYPVAIQEAQSDRAQWRYRWLGQAI